jgi:Uma2 family endonuclease
MKWQDICEDKNLTNLPYKIELNKWGQIIMSPAKIKHSYYQGIIAQLINSISTNGFAFPECAIQTLDNTKVADVVWCSEERLAMIEDEITASIAPEICVEIISSSNSEGEMRLKMDLYFQAQAQEVWFCDREGNMRFYNKKEELKNSELIPDFPLKISRIIK